jgi:uncharacterized protein YxeA
MNFDFKTVLGIVYILYGLLKVLLGVALFTVPKDVLFKKAPFIKNLVSPEEDDTISGQLYEYVLLVFGLFTFFNGMSLVRLLPEMLISFFEYKWTEYTVFIILGLLLTIFYSLVLFTKTKIPKHEDQTIYYKFYGLGGGIFFLLMPFIFEGISYASPMFNDLSMEAKSMIVLTTMLTAFGLAGWFYNKKLLVPVYEKRYENVKSKLKDL